MKPFNIDKWLDRSTINPDTHPACTDDYIKLLIRNAYYDARHRDNDTPDTRQAIAAGAAAIINDEITPEETTRDWKLAQYQATIAHARMIGAIAAYTANHTEYDAAAKFGLTRTTIRKALGK